MTEQPGLPAGPPFPFIPVDGGYFDANAALLRAEMRLRMEIAAHKPPDPRSFVILSGIA